MDEQAFRRELADCRTFGFLHEVEALRAMGLARGGTLENCVVIDGDRVLNPEGLRRPDEFVRHKALDAIGDLYVLGAPILGRFEGVLAGHAHQQPAGPRARRPARRLARSAPSPTRSPSRSERPLPRAGPAAATAAGRLRATVAWCRSRLLAWGRALGPLR